MHVGNPAPTAQLTSGRLMRWEAGAVHPGHRGIVRLRYRKTPVRGHQLVEATCPPDLPRPVRPGIMTARCARCAPPTRRGAVLTGTDANHHLPSRLPGGRRTRRSRCSSSRCRWPWSAAEAARRIRDGIIIRHRLSIMTRRADVPSSRGSAQHCTCRCRSCSCPSGDPDDRPSAVLSGRISRTIIVINPGAAAGVAHCRRA